jgi:hypothetical protein
MPLGQWNRLMKLDTI